MRIDVVCAVGRAAEPQRFVLGEHTIDIEALLDRWYGATVDYFRVRGDDGDTYVLKHVRPFGRWELACFTGRESRGTRIEATSPRVLH